jgi:ketosteroid isomerase-like protein
MLEVSPEQFLREYERRLGEHQWSAVANLIHNDAVFIFSEGTYHGKVEIGRAFTRTFETIQNEQYTISNLEWLVITDEVAVCIYDFHWQGIVNGQEMSGGGRGTTVLQKSAMGWQIVHEHLSSGQR